MQIMCTYLLSAWAEYQHTSAPRRAEIIRRYLPFCRRPAYKLPLITGNSLIDSSTSVPFVTEAYRRHKPSWATSIKWNG